MEVIHGRSLSMNVFKRLVGSGSSEHDLGGAFMISFLTASDATGSNTDEVQVHDGSSGIDAARHLDGSLSISDRSVAILSVKKTLNLSTRSCKQSLAGSVGNPLTFNRPSMSWRNNCLLLELKTLLL